LWSEGYKTPDHPGTGGDTLYYYWSRPFLYLTSKDLSALGCVRTGNEFSTATRNISLWRCD